MCSNNNKKKGLTICFHLFIYSCVFGSWKMTLTRSIRKKLPTFPIAGVSILNVNPQKKPLTLL